jgi:uncharacterized protein DUF6444
LGHRSYAWPALPKLSAPPTIRGCGVFAKTLCCQRLGLTCRPPRTCRKLPLLGGCEQCLGRFGRLSVAPEAISSTVSMTVQPRRVVNSCIASICMARVCWSWVGIRAERATRVGDTKLPPKMVTVQLPKTSPVRTRLLMTYPVAMEPRAAFPPDMWPQTPPKAQAYIRARAARLAALESMVQALQEPNRAFHEQRNQTSRTSSRPPSSDPPQSHRPRRPEGKHRRGGQPGHPGQTRTLIPVEEVDEVVAIKPAQGRGCHAPFSGDAPTPFRHQVIEMPSIKPLIGPNPTSLLPGAISVEKTRQKAFS